MKNAVETAGTTGSIFAGLLLALLPAGAAAETIVSGQLRTTASVAEITDTTVKGAALFGRLALKTKTDGGTGAEAAYELLLYARPKSGPAATPLIAGNPGEVEWRYSDTGNPVNTWEHGEHGDTTTELRQNLDRLLVFFSTGPVDTTIGRQAVGFGPGKFANPTDVFVPWRYDDVIRIDRGGIDAVRAKTSLGGFRTLDTGIVTGDDGRPENNAGFMRFSDNFAGTDAGLIAVRFRENTLAGFDLQGSVINAGVWLEASHVRFAEAHTLRADGTKTKPALNRLVTGSDYIFSDGTYVAGEAILNDQGYTGRDVAALTDPRFAEARIALTGKSYAGFTINHPLQPLLVIGSQTLWNAGDGSVLIMPSATWSLSDSSELVGGISAGTGDRVDEFSSGSRRFWASVAAYF